MEIKKGDTVVMLTGKDKGKKGTVVKASPADKKVVVEGLNMVVKHVKPRGANQPGGKMDQPAAVDVSNVMLVCPVCGMPTKVAHEKVDGKNVRKCKKCGAILDGKSATKKASAKKATAKKSKKAEEVPAEKTAPVTEQAEQTTEQAPKKAAKKATKKKQAE